MSNPGKRFEAEVRKGFQHAFPDAFVHRFIDNYQPDRMVKGHASPPDLLVIRRKVNLIECKSTAGPSIRFDRLAPHQEELLTRFKRFGHGAYIAVEFRITPKGMKLAKREAYLVPVLLWIYWREYGTSRGVMKSVNVEHIRAATWRIPSYNFVKEKGMYVPRIGAGLV